MHMYNKCKTKKKTKKKKSELTAETDKKMSMFKQSNVSGFADRNK